MPQKDPKPGQGPKEDDPIIEPVVDPKDPDPVYPYPEPPPPETD